MDLSASVESRHRLLEARPGLKAFTLSLSGHNHRILLPENGDLGLLDKKYLIQRAVSLRWIVGPGELKIGNHPAASAVLNEAFSEGGSHAFETRLFSALPPSSDREDIEAINTGELELFLDLGGSTLKGLLFFQRKLACQLSIGWEPFEMSQLGQLTGALTEFIDSLLQNRSAADVAHVSVSSAGICRNGAILVSSLTQGMNFSADEPYDPFFLRKLIARRCPTASYRLINDGSVTSLPTHIGQRSEKNVLSLVMGSNLGGGHSQHGGIHELAFVPFLFDAGITDPWSGHPGIATCYFSKIGLLALAAAEGYTGGRDREIITQLHRDFHHGLRPARRIFQSLGAQIGHYILYLQRFYQIDEVLLSGGIITAEIVDEMQSAYSASYNQLAGKPVPPLRMLVISGSLPEFNQVWSLAQNHFHHAS